MLSITLQLGLFVGTIWQLKQETSRQFVLTNHSNRQNKFRRDRHTTSVDLSPTTWAPRVLINKLAGNAYGNRGLMLKSNTVTSIKPQSNKCCYQIIDLRSFLMKTNFILY